MGILTNSGSDFPKLINDHIDLFDCFKRVYLFGSVLKDKMYPSDIDILVIYQFYSNDVANKISVIADELEKASGFPIDLTVLSIKEENETAFLEKIKPYYLRIK